MSKIPPQLASRLETLGELYDVTYEKDKTLQLIYTLCIALIALTVGVYLGMLLQKRVEASKPYYTIEDRREQEKIQEYGEKTLYN